jgi:uncharacterized delta-60 repeat protein
MANTGNEEIAVARYNDNGSLDTTFDGDGKVFTPIGTGRDNANSLALLADGRIVVGGMYENGAAWDHCAVRYLSNGALDTSFDGDGKFVTPALGGGVTHAPVLQVQPDGRLLLGGTAQTGGVRSISVARLNTDGSLDASYGTAGKTAHALSNVNGQIYDEVLQPDGRLLLAGRAFDGTNHDTLLCRLNVDGTLDTAFAGGMAVQSLAAGHDTLFAVALAPNGTIIGAGSAHVGGGVEQVLVARFLGGAPVTLNTLAAAPIGLTTATLNGSVNPNGAVTSAWFEYGLTTGYGSTTSTQAISNGTSAMPVSANLTGLAAFTTYHFRVVAQNGMTTAYGADLSFTTNTAAQVFANAMTIAGLTGPDASLDATPLNDGVENLLKYAFNMNLSGPDSATMLPGGTSGLPGITAQANGASSIFRYEFLRRKNSGLIYTPQKSGDINNPNSWANLTDTPTVISIDDNWERVIYEEAYNATTTPRCFGRVQVSLP